MPRLVCNQSHSVLPLSALPLLPPEPPAADPPEPLPVVPLAPSASLPLVPLAPSGSLPLVPLLAPLAPALPATFPFVPPLALAPEPLPPPVPGLPGLALPALAPVPLSRSPPRSTFPVSAPQPLAPKSPPASTTMALLPHGLPASFILLPPPHGGRWSKFPSRNRTRLLPCRMRTKPGRAAPAASVARSAETAQRIDARRRSDRPRTTPTLGPRLAPRPGHRRRTRARADRAARVLARLDRCRWRSTLWPAAPPRLAGSPPVSTTEPAPALHGWKPKQPSAIGQPRKAIPPRPLARRPKLAGSRSAWRLSLLGGLPAFRCSLAARFRRA